jgi:hypothetical protein
MGRQPVARVEKSAFTRVFDALWLNPGSVAFSKTVTKNVVRCVVCVLRRSHDPGFRFAPSGLRITPTMSLSRGIVSGLALTQRPIPDTLDRVGHEKHRRGM